MHWSKSRHIQYETCPRQFFYEVIAAPQNPKIAALSGKVTAPLSRHDAVRQAVVRLARTPTTSVDVVLSESRDKMLSQLENEADVNAQMSIVEACVRSFVEELNPKIQQASIAYITNGEPVEFIYDGLSVMALPELAVERAGELQVYQFKTGSPNWATGRDRELRLRAGGLTCWARRSLPNVTLPVSVFEVYLRSSPLSLKPISLNDQEVREFVTEAKDTRQRYAASAKIVDFPAIPTMKACRWCSFKPICPEHRAFAEVDYTLDGLSSALEGVENATTTALTSTGGELRQVFLSHVSEDKNDIVRPFARALEAAGISYWLDEAELMWGDDLVKGINQGLATSDYVIAFITTQFLERGWPTAEMNASFVAGVKGKKRLLPVMVADRDEIAAAYPLLGQILSKSWDEGIPALIAELQRVMRR